MALPGGVIDPQLSGERCPGALGVVDVTRSCRQPGVELRGRDRLQRDGGWLVLRGEHRTGANTAAAPSTIGSGESSVNALAITSNGQTAYTADNNVSGGTTKIDIENITTGTSTTVSGVPATNISSGNLVAGGIDPLNGDYYYGGWNSAGSIFTLFKFNGTTGTEVGTITPSGASLTFAHGDLAFDNSGNMYLLAGDTALDAGLLLSVSASNLPSSGTSAIPNSLLTTIKAPSGDSENYAGMTFESDSYLYVVTNDNPSLLYKVNPNTGVVSSGYPINQTGISDPSDMASCSYSGSLTLQKNVVGRVAASDQFNLSITGNGITGGNTATTTGTATGVQAAKAGPVVGIPAQTYTIAETAASGSLSNYSTTYSCLNGSASFASGSGTSVALPAFPAASGNSGAQIVCTFTNTPATLSITEGDATTSVTNVGGTDQLPVHGHEHRAGVADQRERRRQPDRPGGRPHHRPDVHRPQPNPRRRAPRRRARPWRPARRRPSAPPTR